MILRSLSNSDKLHQIKPLENLPFILSWNEQLDSSSLPVTAFDSVYFHRQHRAVSVTEI